MTAEELIAIMRASGDGRYADQWAAILPEIRREARRQNFLEFRRELVGTTLPHEEKDLTMQIKRVVYWVDRRLAELQGPPK